MDKETVKILVRSKKFAVAAASLLSALGGAALGATIAIKKLETKYSEIAEQEIREAKAFYALRNKDNVTLDELAKKYEMVPDITDQEIADQDAAIRSEMVEAAAEIAESQQYVSYDKPVATVETVTETDEGIEVTGTLTEEGVETVKVVKKNIFAVAEVQEFDIDDELDKKHRGLPYILEKDEFFENESGYSQITCTYFEGDDVLMEDQGDTILDETEELGVDNLKFGCGSEDKNIVYIRNDALGKEYEVARSSGTYAEEVAGLKHSDDSPGLRKFRDRD